MIEIWKPVVGFEGFYEVSDLGNVRSTKFNPNKKRKNLAQVLLPCGYKYVTLSHKPKHKNLSVHRLVGFSHVPNPLNKPHINHKDSNRLNNNSSNLEWVTISENAIHGNKYGFRVPTRGTKSWNCKLTEAKVKAIRRLRKNGMVLARIAEKFGVSSRNIRSIVDRNSWRHI